MEPRKYIRMHHAYSVCIAHCTSEATIRATCHILFSCFLFQIEFPTLLAKREIIANAFVFTHNVLGYFLSKKVNPSAKVAKIMEITATFWIFLLFYWNIFVILRQKGDNMVEKYLDDIYKSGEKLYSRLWANGKFGSIYDLEDNCVLRFIEVPNGTHYKYKEEDWKEKTPVLASGIVVWWLLYRRSKSVFDIFESYYQMRLAQYKARREKDADSWKYDIEDEFLHKEWLKIEDKCVNNSQALFDFVSERDGKEIQDIINAYWCFIDHTKLLSKISSHMDADDLLELEYKILDILSLHGDEIDPNKKDTKQIYDFKELRFYTKEEITEASLDMQKKGWISCFVDDTEDGLGPAYWHKLLSLGVIALREFLKKSHSNNNALQNENQCELPSDIDTARARRYFQRAIDKGYILLSGDKYVWKGIDGKANKSQLAYLCGKIFNYKHGINGNCGSEFPEASLGELFGIKRLYSLLSQVYCAQKPQRWREQIDALFDE